MDKRPLPVPSSKKARHDRILILCDGQSEPYPICEETARKLPTIWSAIEDLGGTSDPIPLPISLKQLKLVLQSLIIDPFASLGLDRPSSNVVLYNIDSGRAYYDYLGFRVQIRLRCYQGKKLDFLYTPKTLDSFSIFNYEGVKIMKTWTHYPIFQQTTFVVQEGRLVLTNNDWSGAKLLLPPILKIDNQQLFDEMLDHFESMNNEQFESFVKSLPPET